MLPDKSEGCIGSVILLGCCLWQELALLVDYHDSFNSGYIMPYSVSVHMLFADLYAAVMTTSFSLAIRGRGVQGGRVLDNSCPLGICKHTEFR